MGRMQVLGSQIGLSFTSKSLREQVEAAGWQVTKIKFDSKSARYIAEAKNERGVKVERKGKTEQLALSNLLIAVHNRTTSSVRLGRWNEVFTSRLEEIAQAYSKAPIYEPKASASFLALAQDCQRRVDVLANHLEIQVVPDPEPYKTAEQLSKDVKKSGRLKVSRAGAEHPVWTEQQVVAYRICHDVFGYVASGAGWDWPGENEAFAYHVQLVPEEAQKALFTESIAQTAYAAYYRAYGQQKVALFPQFMDQAQEKNNPFKGHPGVHPSQTLPPAPQPSVKPIVSGTQDAPWLTVTGAVDPSLADPNLGWQSNHFEDPITMPNGLTIQEAYGDPIDSAAVADTARMIDREWAYLNQNDPGDVARMKAAIVQAFRTVILSPKKSLKWNAIHTQDLSSVPPEETNPRRFYDTINKAREDWNVARGHDRYGHVPYMGYINRLVNILYQRHPEKGFPAAQQAAKDLVFDWVREEQERIADADKKGRMPDFQIENAANKAMGDRLDLYSKEHVPNLDKAMTSQHRKNWKQQMQEDPHYLDEFRPPAYTAATVPETSQLHEPGPKLDVAKYQGFMNNHLVQLAQVGDHVDEILKAALEDVHQHDGTGHHFRAAVMQLGIPGISNKTCSFAWLLLAPMTSELGTIDVHMMDILGHDEKDMTTRDYYGYERMLRAARDAAGYAHIPLGQFQWGMWDYKRTGPGTHQDHSALAVENPTDPNAADYQWHPNMYQTWWLPPEQQIDMNGLDLSKEKDQKRVEPIYKQAWRTNPPEWWAQTKPAQEQAWNDWIESQDAAKAPVTKIPFQGLPAGYTTANVKVSMRFDDAGNIVPVYQLKPNERSFPRGARYPWLIHPRSGERLQGQPGETIMSHALGALQVEDPREVWRQLPDEAVGKDPVIMNAW